MPKQLVERLLDSPLRNAAEIASLCPDRLDPVSRLFAKTPSSPKGTTSETLESYIFRHLGHIPVNPSNAERTRALAGAYTFSEKPTAAAAQFADAQSEIANLNEATSKKFFEDLILAAERQQRIIASTAGAVDGRSPEDQRLYVLDGPRGCGKTFFINYMLSRYADELNKSKVLWVRVDLTKETWRPGQDSQRLIAPLSATGAPDTSSDASDNDLLNWLYAQATKIVFRYYSSDSKFYSGGRADPAIDVKADGLFDALKSYIGSYEFENRRPDLEDGYVRMKEVFGGHAVEQPLRGALVRTAITRRVFDFLAREKGYKFIFILDGFDRLDVTDRDQSRFDDLVEDLVQLAGATDLLGFVLLTAMRTNTFDNLHSSGPGRRVPVAKRFGVVPHGLTEIVASRIDFLKKEMFNSLAKWSGQTRESLQNHLRRFQEFLETEADGDSRRLESLVALFGPNRRAQMQILQLLYFDFIGSIQKYRAIERMIKAGFRYPPVHYQYTIAEGKIVTSRGDDIGLDNRFIPSLFRYPFCVSGSGEGFEHTADDLLLGLRICQIVTAFEVQRRQSGDPQHLAVFEIANVAGWLFGYDRKMVIRYIVECIEFELWLLRTDDGVRGSGIDNMRVLPLAKLGLLLDRFIFDIAYLNLAIMRSPICVTRHAGAGISMPFVEAATYDRGDGEESLEKWILAKFFNSISAYRLIRETNRIQERKVRETSRNVSNRKRYLNIRDAFINSEPFEFIGTMRQKLAGELTSLISTPLTSDAAPPPCATTEFNLRADLYQKDWC